MKEAFVSWKKLRTGEPFKGVVLEGWNPSDNLTAAMSDEERRHFRQLLEDGTIRFKFDPSRV